MSQPENQPEERGDAGRGDAARRRPEQRHWRGDLLGRPFPTGDWGEPATRLDELYRWVEQDALRTAAWYFDRRLPKRRAARVLRCGAVLGAAGGVALALLDLTGLLVHGTGTLAAWGGLSLLLAAVCVVADRSFGLTAGWMRDVATAQAVLRRLEALQYDWAAESVREVLGPTEGTASEATERCLGVLRRFSEDVTELVRAETAGWVADFRGGATPVLPQAAPTAPRGEAPCPPPARGGRFPHQPGIRPHMPRQRPGGEG